MFTERLYLEEIQKLLHYRDRRSIRRWCRNNHVRILSDNGSNKQFVLRDEFERELNNLHSKSPVEKKFYKRMLKRNLIDKVKRAAKYRPQGEYEKDFLSIFTNLL